MSGIDALRDRVAAAARDSVQGDRDVVTQVMAFRGEDHICSIMALAYTHPEQLLGVAHLLAAGMEPTAIAVAIDTWATPLKTNPVTGKKWEPDEVGHVGVHHDGVAKGWVSEALHVFAVSTAGDLSSFTMPYRRDAAGVITFQDIPASAEDHDADEDHQFRGYLPDGLRRIMETTPGLRARMQTDSYREWFKASCVGMTEVQIRAAQDTATIQQLLHPPGAWASRLPQTVGVMMGAIADTERGNLIREGMQRLAENAGTELMSFTYDLGEDPDEPGVGR